MPNERSSLYEKPHRDKKNIKSHSSYCIDMKLCNYYFNDQIKFFITLVLVPVRCYELAEPIAAVCAKAHSARLLWWLVDGLIDYTV